MRLVTFVGGGETRLGARRDDLLIDFNAAYAANHNGNILATDMLDFIRQGPDALKTAQALIGEMGVDAASPFTYTADQAQILAPISNPSKVIAVGLNYWDHCRENDIDPPQVPILFTKFTTAIIGPGDAITWNPAVTQAVDYEVELAFVVGKEAKGVKAEDAADYILGYTICNDISARDLQFAEGQWVRAKSLDTFCPIGPEIVTSDEISDPQNLPIRCLVNGELLQDSNTKEMIFPIGHIFEFISAGCRLLPGDIVTTGTPDGVGAFRDPKIFLKPGDTIMCEIEGIGRLENPVK